jgi:hypothetical protein
MYEGLISQLVPLTAKAAGAVDLLNKSDINWLDGTGSSKQYKAGGAQAAHCCSSSSSTAVQQRAMRMQHAGDCENKS